MKKILLLLLFFLISELWKGQAERNFGSTPDPVPSAATFASYTNIPVSLSTGIPNVSIPLFTLQAGNSLSLPIGLRYHVYNTEPEKPSGEVGLGWSLSKGGSISRIINKEPDEKYDDPSKSGYRKNAFDDIYYYNIPGNSGKFGFVRDTVANTFMLNNISGNHVKIEFTRTANTATLVLASLRITDDKGFTYIFNDYSIASRDNYKTNYRSAFYLSSILNESNHEIAAFTYQKNTKYSGTFIKYQNCNLMNVITDNGSIVFENNYEQKWETSGNSDPNRLISVSLKDRSGRQVSKYRFEYTAITGSNSLQEKRILSGIYKLDVNQNAVESRSFSYGMNPINPEHTGILTEMRLPEGGRVVYEYEPNEIYKAVSYPGVDNFILKYPKIQRIISDPIFFDTNSGRIYNFQIDTSRTVFITKDSETYYKDQYPLGIHDDPETYDYQITYIVRKGNTIISVSEAPDRYLLSPGTYTLEIKKGFGNGNFNIAMIQTDPPPYRNAEEINIGLRIKEIKQYGTQGMVQHMRYEYSSFDNPLNSSGALYSLETCQSEEYDYLNSLILYTHVKEIHQGSAGISGYSEYYFKTPADFPATDSGFSPHYNILSGGLLFRKEVYDPQHHKESAESTEYTLTEIPNVPEYSICTGKSKASWIAAAKEMKTVFFDNGSQLESRSETTYNAANFEPSYIKAISPDGTVTEKFIAYPSDLNHTRLLNARLLSVPLQVELKINGERVDRTEIKYDHPLNLYPTSTLSYHRQNQSMVAETVFDAYDGAGNLLQATDKSGIPVTTIWGYHGTQPIATVTGLPYSQLKDLQAVKAAIAASDADADDPAQEASLLQALENLRKDPVLQPYSVSAATYNPLTGITNSLSPNGIRTSYLYDSANRLIKVTDGDGKTLKEYQYNYKH